MTKARGRAEDPSSIDSFLGELARVSGSFSGVRTPDVGPGTVIASRYELAKLLGHGAYGVVWSAYDRLSREHVAVKLLTAREEYAARVRVEVVTLRRLHPPGVVHLIDEGMDEGVAFLVMRLVKGRPFPGSAPPASWDAIASTTERLLETLTVVHAAGIVHRDIKPANVLVGEDGWPTILDFGLALASALDPADEDGRVFGTPAYLAPEQLDGRATDGRADLYAVGVMLYQALSGRLPHDQRRGRTLLESKLAPPRPIASVTSHLPDHVAGVVDALLATAPQDRPQSTSDVLKLLHNQHTAPRSWPKLIAGDTVATAEELKTLFAEGDRLSWVRADAARLLHARTDGQAPRVRSEIDAWLRTGRCRWGVGEPQLLVMEPEDVDKLEARLWVRAEEPNALLDESLALARGLAKEGRLGNAVAALHEGLAASNRTPNPVDAVERVLSLWVEIAIADGAPSALDRVLYEICRTTASSPTLSALEALVRTALAVDARTEQALDLASAVPPFASRALERARQSVRVAAARRAPIAREVELIEELRVWSQVSEDPEAIAAFKGWLGRLRYREGRFDEGAVLHEEAAAGSSWVTTRAAALNSEAGALMEAFRLDEAARVAERALSLSCASRHTHGRAQAEWTSRIIAYRRGEPLSPDVSWVDSLARLRMAPLEALACMTESAIAWRTGESDLGRLLALRSERVWRSVGESAGGVLLVAALADANSEPGMASERVAQIVEEAVACRTPGVGIQVLGLLAPRLSVEAVRQDTIEALARQVPSRHWHLRIDVLSVVEAMERLRPFLTR